MTEMECKMAKRSGKKAPAATEGRAADEDTPAAEPVRAIASGSPSYCGRDGGGVAGLGGRHAAALHRSTLALSSGAETVGKEWIDFFGTMLENAGRAAGALLRARTMADVVELNAELIRSNAESLLRRSAKLSEVSIAVAREAVAPFGGSFDAVSGMPAGPRDV
jgi:hypothetical protein